MYHFIVITYTVHPNECAYSSRYAEFGCGLTEVDLPIFIRISSISARNYCPIGKEAPLGNGYMSKTDSLQISDMMNFASIQR